MIVQWLMGVILGHWVFPLAIVCCHLLLCFSIGHCVRRALLRQRAAAEREQRELDKKLAAATAEYEAHTASVVVLQAKIADEKQRLNVLQDAGHTWVCLACRRAVFS